MTEHDLFVEVETGKLVGRARGGVAAFLGIPYAAPPFGSRRMQPPEPVAPWTGIRPCFDYGPTAPKAAYPPPLQPLFPERHVAGEDCLNLNVWAPEVAGSPSLPVMVWIHGGSFVNGAGSIPEFEGRSFARDGVVCVTINYRLGAEGFLLHDDGVANLGLLDQLSALRWVQRNIAAFGGDPTRVTVAGESAGAMSACTLLSMPEAVGLFGQVIAQSGACAHTLTAEQGRLVASRLAERAGVPAERSGFASLPPERLAQHAAELVTELQLNPDPARWGALALSPAPFAPILDGRTLRRDPLSAIAGGQGSNVRLLIGTARDEGRLMFVPTGKMPFIDEALVRRVAGGYSLSPEDVAVYERSRPGASPGDILAAIVGDWMFRIPAIRLAETRRVQGNTWMYRFDYPEPEQNHGLGAAHGIEMPFVFETADLPELEPRLGPAPSREVARHTHETWVKFLRDESPGWDPYPSPRRVTGLIAERTFVVEDPAADERRLWSGKR